MPVISEVCSPESLPPPVAKRRAVKASAAYTTALPADFTTCLTTSLVSRSCLPPNQASAANHRASAIMAMPPIHSRIIPPGAEASVLSAPDWSALPPPVPKPTCRAIQPISRCTTPLMMKPALAAFSIHG